MAKKKPTAADANQDNGAKPPKKPIAKKAAKPADNKPEWIPEADDPRIVERVEELHREFKEKQAKEERELVEKSLAEDPFVKNEFGVIPPQTGETGLTIKGAPLVFIPGTPEPKNSQSNSNAPIPLASAWTGNGAPIDDDTGKPLDLIGGLEQPDGSLSPQPESAAFPTDRTTDGSEESEQVDSGLGVATTQASQPDSEKNQPARKPRPRKITAGFAPFHTPTTKESSTTEGEDGHNTGTTQLATPAQSQKQGDVPLSVSEAGSTPGAELLESSSRARLNGEKKHNYWERMRKAARLAGLPRGQGPGTAYHWATEQTDREFPPPEPVIVEELPAAETPDEPAMSTIVDIPEEPAIEAAPPAPVADLGVSGLGDLPESWGMLPANAQLQVEIAWVSANRLRVRSGTGVDLSRALSPAPSYSALSWLETSILFPSKFADISVKATAQQDDEREGIRREKLAIEEIRSLLAEMLEG